MKLIGEMSITIDDPTLGEMILATNMPFAYGVTPGAFVYGVGDALMASLGGGLQASIGSKLKIEIGWRPMPPDDNE